MRIKEANGLAVWLAVDGEKLDEQRVSKIGDEDDGIRMECYVYPQPNQEFTINVHLGRRTPWKGDYIAEPIINGNQIHSLHIGKNWHVTHKLSSFYQENDGGELMEMNLSFGEIVNPANEIELEQGNDSNDGSNGMIVVEISRGEIERVKPTRKRISQRIKNAENSNNRGRVASGSSKKSNDKTAYGEEFSYDEEDRDKPFLKFVFKIRTKQYLINHGLLHRAPAQQHPSQVSRAVKSKVEPDVDEEEIPPTTTQRPCGYNRPKRELSQESVIPESESAKRLRMAEEEIKSLKELVQRLTNTQNRASAQYTFAPTRDF